METNNKQQYTTENQCAFRNNRTNYNSHYKWRYFIESFKSNPRLRKFLAVTTLLALGIATLVVTILYRLIVKLIVAPDLNI